MSRRRKGPYIQEIAGVTKTGRLRLEKVPKTVRLRQDTWNLIDRNRIAMGMSISDYIQLAVVALSKPYEKARRKSYQQRKEIEGAPSVPLGSYRTGDRGEDQT